jgi:hypothetical protein
MSAARLPLNNAVLQSPLELAGHGFTDSGVPVDLAIASNPNVIAIGALTQGAGFPAALRSYIGAATSAQGAKADSAVQSVSVASANGVSASSSGGTTPALTISLGAITPTSVNGLTFVGAATGFTIAGGTTSKTLTISNTLTLAGTDSSTLNIGAGGTLGTAAFTAASAYATAAQGIKADNAGAVNGLVKSNGSATFSAIADNSANWDTAYADRNKWDGGATGLTASTGRTSLGATAVGANIFTLTNPGAITFLKVAADNTVSAESAATHRTSLGATTVGTNLFTLTNPGAITFLQLNADNTVTAQSASAQRTALSLGTAATQNTGASGANVPLLNAANTWTAGQTQTFGADATNPGLRLAGVTADPSGASAGSFWYRTDLARVRIYDGTTSRSLMVLGDLDVLVQRWNANLDTWAGITPATGVGTFLATPTLANLKAAVTDETAAGWNLLTLANPGAITFLQINADNTVTAQSAGAQRTALTLVPGTDVVAFNGALGTPTSGTVTNLTGTASININGTVGATTPAAGTFTTIVAGSTTSLLLGTAGSAVGNIGFRNATSGTATLAPPTGALGAYTVTLPNAASTLPIFGQQITFSGPTAARTVTFPDASFTAARTDAANTFTGVQTMTSAALTTPAITGLATGSGVAAVATVSTLVSRDSSANSAANNWLGGYTTTATAAGTTTLTVGSTYAQFFTGSTTQTVTLPVASTLVLGHSFLIVNSSTGAVTVNSSGANAVLVLAGGTSAIITCILASGTSAASWNATYLGYAVTSGKQLSVSNSLTLAGTDSTTMTFPSTSATIARTDAANTFTGNQTFLGNLFFTDNTYDIGASSATRPRDVYLAGSVKQSTALSARAYNSANISINSATLTKLTFDSERWDNDTIHSTSSNTGRLTATTAGIYMISAGVQWASNSTGNRELLIKLNDTTYILDKNCTAVTGAGTLMNVTTQYNLAAGDYVELVVYQDSGGALNIVTAGNYSPEFMMTRIA